MDDKHEADDKPEAPKAQFKPHIPKLLPVPNGLVKPNDRLCTICEGFKLTPHDFFVLKGDKTREKKMKEGEPEMVCGALSDIMKKGVNCPLCRLIYKSLGEEVPKQGRGKLSTIIVSLRWMTRPGSNKPPIARTLSIKLSSSQPDSDRETLHNLYAKRLFPSIGMLANDALGPIPTKFKSDVGRVIPKDKINFRMVRNWVDICVSRHSESCSGMPALLAPFEIKDPVDDIPSLRMVDVIDNCIVLAPQNCKYCALSYVWGRMDPNSILTTLMNNVTELEKPGALADPKHRDRIPRTIRDAMYVVKKLGVRYLWTDSLCIIQDDLGKGGTKMQAISKMNVVYGMAVLTIIAASGKDAHSGLPGVHPGSDRSQLIEEISPGLRLCYMDTFQDHTHDAVYYTRGWTYQEKAFSKRNLLFAGNQVTYICGMFENCREDRPCEKGHADPQSNGYSYYDDGQYDDIGKIEGTFSSYSRLSLTYESDIYHCMAAAMNVLVARLLNGHLCHGTPDVFFDWFLLWEPWVVLKRRSVTPSWSWTGWEGRTTSHIWKMCGRDISGVREQHGERSWIVWYQRKAHDSDEYIRVGSDADDSSPNVKEKLFSFDCTTTLPTPRTLIGAPVYLEDTYNPQPASGFLQFWAVSVLFDLREATTSDDRREARHGHARAGIFGRSGGKELGTVLLDPTWYQAHVPGQHEFIILCEARVDTSENGKRSNSDWLFKMMLIERCGQGQWAERVGLCAIDKLDLKEGLEDGPVWKEIVLG